MSIRDTINDRIEEERLFRLELVVPDAPIERTMLVTPGIRRLFVGPWADTRERERFGRLRADLEMFVEGGVIAVALEPYRAKAAYMGRLADPSDEVWDIRSRDPKPGLRVFGRFAEQDVFVALHWDVRKEYGDRNCELWDWVIGQCKADWVNLFHPHPAISGSDIHDYISSNVFLVGDN